MNRICYDRKAIGQRSGTQVHDSLTQLFDNLLQGASADHRAIAGNFLMEQRLPASLRATYREYFGHAAVANLGEWRTRHGDFLAEQVQLIGAAAHPWTFGPQNSGNLKPQDPITVLRIESLSGAIGLSGSKLSPSEIERWVRELRTGTAEQQNAARTVLSRGLIGGWNGKRDRRPQFATNLAGVDDLLPGDPWTGSDWGWVSDLRDHLGLGGYVPKASGEPFPVLVMIYALADVAAACRPAWDGRVAVPTVLDGDLFQYFFPSPLAPDPTAAGEHYPVGRTLNLAPGLNANDYGDHMGTEFLHPCFDYQPEHCWAVAYIDRPLDPALSLSGRRRCHLDWVRLWAGHDQFAADIPL